MVEEWRRKKSAAAAERTRKDQVRLRKAELSKRKQAQEILDKSAVAVDQWKKDKEEDSRKSRVSR